MNTMIEKISRAICDDMQKQLTDPLGVYAGPGSKLNLDQTATVVLECLREPTPEMVDAGVALALNVRLSGAYTWSHYIEDLYIAMTNAALADKGEG